MSNLHHSGRLHLRCQLYCWPAAVAINRVESWLRDRLDSSQQKDIASDPHQKNQGCGREGGGEGVRRGADVTSNDGRADRCNLATEVHRPRKCTDAFPWRNQGRNSPCHGRGCSQPSESQADPHEGGGRAMSPRRPEDPETERHPCHQNGLANPMCVVTTLNESVHQPSPHQKVRSSRKQPGHTGVED